MDPEHSESHKLPDPWLFDSEALLRQLDRCRETVLQLPITNPNATHFGIQLADASIWNLSQTLRSSLHLHREGQRRFRRKHEEELAKALSQQQNNPERPPRRAARQMPKLLADKRVARARTV